MERREIYHIQISENYKTPTSQSYYEVYFITANLDRKLIHLLSHTATIETKWRIFYGKILSNIHFPNNILFKFKKVGSPPFSSCKVEDENYNISCIGAKKTSISWTQVQSFFSTGLDIRSILPESAIFGFPDDDSEQKLVLNHILPIFKNYLHKARENKIFNFNILKNYLTKRRDLEANSKDNEEYEKKWTLISIIMFQNNKIKWNKSS